MPTIRPLVSLTANETNSNVVQGSIYEYQSRPTRIIIAGRSADLLAAATGTNIGVQFGSRTMCLASETSLPGGPLNGTAGSSSSPQIPEDVVVDDVAMPGDRLVISLTDRGGASDVQLLVSLTEVM